MKTGLIMNLQKQLSETVSLLETVEEVYWAEKLSKIEAKINRHKNTCWLKELLSYFGGMGSFNDLVISNVNGHKLYNKSENELNWQLNQYRQKIYQFASELLD